MNLPKQSRPVVRDVSRDPISARVKGSRKLRGPEECPWWVNFMDGSWEEREKNHKWCLQRWMYITV